MTINVRIRSLGNMLHFRVSNDVMRILIRIRRFHPMFPNRYLRTLAYLPSTLVNTPTRTFSRTQVFNRNKICQVVNRRMRLYFKRLFPSLLRSLLVPTRRNNTIMIQTIRIVNTSIRRRIHELRFGSTLIRNLRRLDNNGTTSTPIMRNTIRVVVLRGLVR